MNSPILWRPVRQFSSVPFTRVKSTLFHSRFAKAVMVAAVALTLSPLAVPVHAQNPPDQQNSLAKASPPPQIKVDSSVLSRSTGALTSFAPVVDKVGPSIVTIFTTKNVKEDANPSAANPMQRRFFGAPDNSGPMAKKAKEEGYGLGSGVIVSTDGLILTNNHVAEAGDDIKVRIGSRA